MTIFDTSIDFFIATLFRDYLADASSITAGLPSNDELPKVVMDMGKEPDIPSLVIAAKEEGSKGARRIVNVSSLLLTWLKADDAAAAEVDEQTTRADAAGWMVRIDQRLRAMKDEGAVSGFKSWVASLSNERRAGWRITKINFNGLAAPMRNKEKRTIFYAATLDIHLVLI